MPNLARAAVWYARHGWAVFPCGERVKEPAIKTGFKAATTDARQVAAWWRVRPMLNVGIACGPASGVYVIDVDQHDVDGEAGLEKLIKKRGELPATVEQMTGGGGRQLFFRYPQNKRLRSKGKRRGPGALPAGVDTRGDGGYVVAPPSIHPSGIRYHWRRGHGPHEMDLATLPEAWIDHLEYREAPTITVPIRRFDRVRDDSRLEQLAKWTESQKAGNRNAGLYWAARKAAVQAKIGLVSVSDIRREMAIAGQNAGLDPVEVSRTVTSALTAEGLA